MKKILLSLVLFISTAFVSDLLTAQNAYFEPVFTVLEQGTSEPIIGASIQIVGTNINALTNFEGKATIQIPMIYSNKSYAVSMAGFQTQTHDLAPIYKNMSFTIYLIPNVAL